MLRCGSVLISGPMSGCALSGVAQSPEPGIELGALAGVPDGLLSSPVGLPALSRCDLAEFSLTSAFLCFFSFFSFRSMAWAGRARARRPTGAFSNACHRRPTQFSRATEPKTVSPQSLAPRAVPTRPQAPSDALTSGHQRNTDGESEMFTYVHPPKQTRMLLAVQSTRGRTVRRRASTGAR